MEKHRPLKRLQQPWKPYQLPQQQPLQAPVTDFWLQTELEDGFLECKDKEPDIQDTKSY